MRGFGKRMLAVVLAFGLTAAARAADTDRYVPADTEQVIVVNVKQLMTSDLVKKNFLPEIEKQLAKNKEYQQMSKATGLDLLKDVNTVVLANTGTTGDKATVILRGKFDLDNIKTTLKAVEKDGKLKISKLGDREMYEADANGKTFYSTFLDGTTMIGSTSEAVVKAAADGKVGKLKGDLAAAVRGVDAKQSMWMAAVIPEEAKKLLDNANQGPVEAMKKVKTITAGLNLTKDLAASLAMQTGDPKAAKELGEFADQLKGLLAFAGQGNEQIAPLVKELQKSLKIVTTRGDLNISFSISGDVITKAAKNLPRRGE
jgi:hypothetical protein